MGSCIRGVNTSDLQALCQQVTTKQITTMSDWSPEYNTDYAELASGTFQGYITGTVKLVFLVFFIFLLLSVLTMMLMNYARYMSRGFRSRVRTLTPQLSRTCCRRRKEESQFIEIS